MVNLNWLEEHNATDLDSKISPLTQAAYLGRKQIVEMLLSKYDFIDLDFGTQPTHYTAVSAACMAGNFEIVQILCENGADVNKCDSVRQSPLIYCFSRMNEACNFYENKTLAVRMMETLLHFGADIN